MKARVSSSPRHPVREAALRTLSRRSLLRGGAGMALALPALEIMRPARARAATPKRFIGYLQPLSNYAGHFFPTEPGGTAFDHESMPLSKNHHSGKGALDNPDYELPYLLEALAPHRRHLTVLEGIDNSHGNHGAYSSTFTGTVGIENKTELISIDQILAEKLGGETKFPSLQVGVANDGSDDKSAASWYGPGRAAPATKSPSQLFDRLFGDFKSDPEAAARLRKEKRSVLDAAMGQATALQDRLGAADRDKLDNYLTSFRAIEVRLDKVGPIGCQPPERPDVDETIKHHGGHENIPIHTSLQLEMLAMAMACDLTRVATFQLATEANNFTFPWLGVSTRWHDMSHYKAKDDWQSPEKKQATKDYVAMSRWSLDQVGFLLDRLTALDVMDETLVLYVVPMDHGGHHSSRNIPILLAGAPEGAIRTGRHVRIDHEKQARHMNDVLVTVAQAMGVELDAIGDVDLNRGPLSQLLR